MLDIRTLALVSGLSSLIFTIAILTTWRQVPEERSLRDWVLGSLLICLGTFEIALRASLNFRLSIPLGNGLIFLGFAYLLGGFRQLLGQTSPRYWPAYTWGSSALVFALCAYFTFVSPSLSTRICLVSIGLSINHLIMARITYRRDEPQLKDWLRFTLLVQVTGAMLYLARAWAAPGSQVTMDYSQTPNWLIAAPGLFTLFANVWMSITVVLVVNARIQQRIVETLKFDQAILGESPVAIATYTASGDCIQANQAYASLMHCSRAQLLMQNFLTLSSWKQSGLLDACLNALSEQKPCRHETHLSTRNQQQLWVDCRISPARINGEPHLLIQFLDLTERKRLEDELRQMAFHDALTRLPNRRLLMNRLEVAQQNSARRQSHGALLFIDLDKFKQLNDRFGHVVGDQVLIEIAQRLREETRKNDTVARLGGDEFVVMLEDLASDERAAMKVARMLADKIQQALARPFTLPGGVYHSGASIGIRLFFGSQDSPSQILDDADQAMYLVKPTLAARGQPSDSPSRQVKTTPN